MKNAHRGVILVLFMSIISAGVSAEEISRENTLFPSPEIAEAAKAYSDDAVQENPLLGQLLQAMGVRYLYELDHTKRYIFDVVTQQFRSEDVHQNTSKTGGITRP
jgi:hypothetical protein